MVAEVNEAAEHVERRAEVVEAFTHLAVEWGGGGEGQDWMLERPACVGASHTAWWQLSEPVCIGEPLVHVVLALHGRCSSPSAGSQAFCCVLSQTTPEAGTREGMDKAIECVVAVGDAGSY